MVYKGTNCMMCSDKILKRLSCINVKLLREDANFFAKNLNQHNISIRQRHFLIAKSRLKYELHIKKLIAA